MITTDAKPQVEGTENEAPRDAGKGLHHRIVIIGGGTAGITVAARLRRAGQDDIAVIEPSAMHYYQPLWTLVGAGRVGASTSERKEASVMPAGVRWLQDTAVAVDPKDRVVTTAAGITVSYDFLVVCPGIQSDWSKIPGLIPALGHHGVSSNYSFELAPKTWQFISALRGGTAVFTMPSGPIKCAGAPQKIAYLAADFWRLQNVLDKIHVILVLPTPKMFGVPEFSNVLEAVAKRYGIDVRLQSEMTSLDASERTLTLVDKSGGDTKTETVHFDFLHAVPPQSAPDWIKASPLAAPGNPGGYVDVDKHTHQHVRYPEIFALGDASNVPTSKTGAAIRKQAPVVVENLLAAMRHKTLSASYDGYTSCPLVTAHNKMLLAEFDYSLKPRPTIPLIDTTKERYDMWLLKRYGLPAMYWNLMLRGLV